MRNGGWRILNSRFAQDIFFFRFQIYTTMTYSQWWVGQVELQFQLKKYLPFLYDNLRVKIEEKFARNRGTGKRS